MHFAFAPGVTPYDRFAKRLFTNRPNTQLIDRRGTTTVAEFFNHLSTAASITLPAEELLIASHGNDRAWMQIHLDSTQREDTDYEVAEAAAKSGSTRLPKNVNHNTDGTLASTSVNFRGCQIGAAAPFVDKLKEAFGGESPTTAPKHFQEIYSLRNAGMMEFLVYSFSFESRTALSDKAAVVDAARSQRFTFRDGSTIVPDAVWTTWVPRDVGIGHRKSKKVFIALGRTLGTLKRILTAVEFRHDRRQAGPFRIPGLPSMPAKDDRLDTLRQSLKSEAAAKPESMFSSEHPFPLYERYGRSDLDDFVDGLEWAFSWEMKTRAMICVGQQHEYSILVPITDPLDLDTGRLIYNFYPPTGSAHTAVDELLTSDATMFHKA